MILNMWSTYFTKLMLQQSESRVFLDDWILLLLLAMLLLNEMFFYIYFCVVTDGFYEKAFLLCNWESVWYSVRFLYKYMYIIIIFYAKLQLFSMYARLLLKKIRATTNTIAYNNLSVCCSTLAVTTYFVYKYGSVCIYFLQEVWREFFVLIWMVRNKYDAWPIV